MAIVYSACFFFFTNTICTAHSLYLLRNPLYLLRTLNLCCTIHICATNPLFALPPSIKKCRTHSICAAHPLLENAAYFEGATRMVLSKNKGTRNIHHKKITKKEDFFLQNQEKI